jgi:predicted kinase
MAALTSPTLIVVSGPPGSGKTTLAHQIARAVGCPAICRDEIKEGMVHAVAGYAPTPGDPLNWRTLTVFFDVLDLLVGAGVSVVAEAAFQDRLWRPGLDRLAARAQMRIIDCTVDPAVAHARIASRAESSPLRVAHDDRTLLQSMAAGALDTFVPVAFDAPTMRVDTTDGYRPGLDDILTFLAQQSPAEGARARPSEV